MGVVNYEDKEVDFATYCETCEYKDLEESYENICEICLSEPSNKYTSKPVKWKEAE